MIANTNSDQYWKCRHRFNASLSWRLSRRDAVFVEGQHLSNTGRHEVTGPGLAYLQEWTN